MQFLSNYQWNFSQVWTKNLQFVWKTQKTTNSQSNLEKEKLSWKTQAPWLQIKLQSYSHQNSMVLGLKKKKKKNWSIYQRWNRKEGPEKNLHTYGHLSYDKGGTNIHRRKDLSSINGVEKNEELHVKELN